MARILLTIVIFLTGIMTMASQEDYSLGSDAGRHAKADSINKAAEDSDFIKVYLIYAHPGNDKIYSVQGHSLLRLVSPSNNLDIIYTFETDESVDNIFRFFRGIAMAGFVYAPTETVLEDYRLQGRRVDQIQLGLTPRQEQQLWKYLDEQMQHQEMYNYDFIKTNCSTMLVSAVEGAVYPSTVDIRKMPEPLCGDFGAFRKGIFNIEGIGPWHQLFWNVTLGWDADKPKTLIEQLVPEFLWSAWKNAVIKDTDGKTRPMTIGKPETILQQTEPYSSLPVTPMMVAVLLLILSLIATFIPKLKTPQRIITLNTYLSTGIDITLMAIQTIIGLWLLYLCPIIDAISTGWNLLLGLFNPLPILLWIFLRRKRAMRHVYALWAAVSIAYIMATPFIPQMYLTPCLTISAGCFAIRSITNRCQTN